VIVEQTSGQSRWRVTIRLLDLNNQPVPGVQPTISFSPPNLPVTVEQPSLTDENGYAVGYVSCTQQVCALIEVEAGGVALREKPSICFQ
jgi:hypothetical protein